MSEWEKVRKSRKGLVLQRKNIKTNLKKKETLDTRTLENETVLTEDQNKSTRERLEPANDRSWEETRLILELTNIRGPS